VIETGDLSTSSISTRSASVNPFTACLDAEYASGGPTSCGIAFGELRSFGSPESRAISRETLVQSDDAFWMYESTPAKCRLVVPIRPTLRGKVTLPVTMS